MSGKFFQVEHPVLQHKVSQLRNKNTSNAEFRRLTHDISFILGLEATRQLLLKKQLIQTPLEAVDAPVLADPSPVFVPILRAGMSMVDAMLELFPEGKVGHIGSYRDKATKMPHRYYFNLPAKTEKSQYFLCDPMLATGGSAVDAIDQLKEVGIKNIVFLCIIACPEGVEAVAKSHPDVKIIAASLDRQLNENRYILPWLGDAGDRFYAS